MNLVNLKENIERLKTTLSFYDELMKKRFASKVELENIRLKRKYVKEQILRMGIHNKKIIQEIEETL